MPRGLRAPIALTVLVAAVAFPSPAVAHCFDGLQDGTETDVDCGGACGPCEYGGDCGEPRDCTSGLCSGGRCDERSYDSDEPVPSGYHVEVRQHDGAATARRAGWGFFGVGYAGAYVTGMVSPNNRSVMYVPVYGAWKLGVEKGTDLRSLYILDAVLQSVGVVLVVGGYASAGRHLVRDEVDRPLGLVPAKSSKVRSPARTVVVTPAPLGPRSLGLGLVGRF